MELRREPETQDGVLKAQRLSNIWLGTDMDVSV